MKLIMIMGMQRSGTTALFESLRPSPKLVTYEESADSLIYNDYFLRPESEIRHVLEAARFPVLLKPVRESERRTLASVIDEYADYDLSILWLYRDPVNVAFSYLVQGWLDGTTSALERTARNWVARNRMPIQLPAALRPRLTLLRYEDLVSDSAIFKALERKLGIRGYSTLGPDPNSGRRQLPLSVQARIGAITSETLLDLHRLPTGLEPRRSPSGGTPDSIPASVAIDLESESFQREPYACLGRLREYRRHHPSEFGTVYWLSEYDEVSHALLDSAHFNDEGSRLLKDNSTEGEQRLRDVMAGAKIQDSAKSTSASLQGLAREIFTTHLGSDKFNLADVCLIAIAAMFYHLLGVDTADADGLFERTIRGETIEALSGSFLREGWISRIATQPSLSNADLRRFLEFGVYYHWVTAIFATSAVHFLLGDPAVLNRVRRAPDRFPAAFTELTRLAYPLLVVERWTSAEVEVATRKIPANKLIYLSIAAANRDPGVFERPDEFVMERSEPATSTKPLSGYGGACLARAHWEKWGHLACEALLKELLTKFPALETVHPLAESKFTISPSSGELRQALQIPFLRYLRTLDVKFQA